MGLYIWMAIGFTLGVIARSAVRKRVESGWLEPALMGIAGGVVGGWVGARLLGDSGINAVGFTTLIGAAIGGALLSAVYLSSRRRRTAREPKTLQADETPRRAA